MQTQTFCPLINGICVGVKCINFSSTDSNSTKENDISLYKKNSFISTPKFSAIQLAELGTTEFSCSHFNYTFDTESAVSILLHSIIIDDDPVDEYR